MANTTLITMIKWSDNSDQCLAVPGRSDQTAITSEGWDRLTQQASDRIISVSQTPTVGISQRGIWCAWQPIHHVELMTAALGEIHLILKGKNRSQNMHQRKLQSLESLSRIWGNFGHSALLSLWYSEWISTHTELHFRLTPLLFNIVPQVQPGEKYFCLCGCGKF